MIDRGNGLEWNGAVVKHEWWNVFALLKKENNSKKMLPRNTKDEGICGVYSGPRSLRGFCFSLFIVG